MFNKTLKAAEQGQRELFEKLKDKGPKLQFSMKKQTNEDVFEQFSFEPVPDNFTSVELKKEKRQKTLEKRTRLADEIIKRQEAE